MKSIAKFLAALIFMSGLFSFSFLSGSDRLSTSSLDLLFRKNITKSVKVSANSSLIQYFDLNDLNNVDFVNEEADFTAQLVPTHNSKAFSDYSEQTFDLILSTGKQSDLPESFKKLNFEEFWKGEIDEVTAFGSDIIFVAEKEYFELIKNTFPNQFKIQILEVEFDDGRIENENEILIEPVFALKTTRRMIKIDDMSPLDKNFIPQDYPLSFSLVFEKSENLDFIDSKIQELISSFDSKILNRDKLISFGFGGTAVASKQLFYLIEDKGVDYLWENIGTIGQDLDYFIVDSEMAVTDDCIVNLYTNFYCITPEVLEGYKNAGVNLVNVSNDHVLDFGENSFEETVLNFSTFGIQSIGNPDPDFSEPVIIKENGTKFGIISFNITERGLNISNLERVENLIDQTDFTFIYLHETADYLDEPNQNTKEIVRELKKLGADFVLVNGSHTVKPISDDGKTVYGLGNLIFDQLQSESVRESKIITYTFYYGELIQVSDYDFVYDKDFVSERV